jgi:hypothetical protein
VVVIPGFVAPVYPGAVGVPTFPSSDPGLSSYTFAELASDAITASSLEPYDTIILYGLRWNDLPAEAQAAINQFARTGKVVIWDADATGPQDYASFVHPFATSATGEPRNNQRYGPVVSFAGGENPLASDNPASPQYLDPAVLVSSNHLVNDMNVMHPGAAGWAESMFGANQILPDGGWVLAWGYGVTGDHSGLVIYSGLDADAFTDNLTPNYALKELAIQLAVPFLRTPDAGCAPGCSPPDSSSGSGGGSGSGGTTYAQCAFVNLPRSWVRGSISVVIRTSVASNVSARAETPHGEVLGRSYPNAKDPSLLRLTVDTRLLRSNQDSPLLAVVYVGKAKACTLHARLKVDNDPPRLIKLRIRRTGGNAVLQGRASEPVTVSLSGPGLHAAPRFVTNGEMFKIALPNRPHAAKLVLVDRAGNRLIRNIVW